MTNKKRAVRAYRLKLVGNKAKIEIAKYTLNRFRLYCEMLIAKIFFGQKVSTRGMGLVANLASYKCINSIRALKAASRKTKNKINVPTVKNFSCVAKLEKGRNRFDYWVAIQNLWEKYELVRLPAKSHKALNRALKKGWKLSNQCEFTEKDGLLYVFVFVSKEISTPSKPSNFLGVDVGIRQSVSASDGYLGHGLSKIIRTQKRRQAERRRQNHKISNKVKTNLKQILDREAKRILRRSQNLQCGISIEKPKRLSNLRSGRLQGWARSYFGNRINILARECNVYVEEVSPYQTSITCSKCLHIEKLSRLGRIFHCVKCGHTDHADVNAANNIKRLASETSGRKNLINSFGV